LHPVGLALRPQRGSLGGWSIRLFCGGVSHGSIGSDLEDFVGDDETPADLVAQAGGSVTGSIFATTLRSSLSPAAVSPFSRRCASAPRRRLG